MLENFEHVDSYSTCLFSTGCETISLMAVKTFLINCIKFLNFLVYL